MNAYAPQLFSLSPLFSFRMPWMGCGGGTLASYNYVDKCPMRSILGEVKHSAYRYLRCRSQDAQHHGNIRGIAQKLWFYLFVLINTQCAASRVTRSIAIIGTYAVGTEMRSITKISAAMRQYEMRCISETCVVIRQCWEKTLRGNATLFFVAQRRFTGSLPRLTVPYCTVHTRRVLLLRSNCFEVP